MNQENLEGQIEAMIVSPDMARQFLAKQRTNRPMRNGVVARYAADMRSGRWRLKGQSPILFDREGYMVNGQHRCFACIQSGSSFPVYIIRDCDPEDVDNIDTGITRSLADALAWRGESQPQRLATVIRWTWLYETGKISRHYTKTPTRTEAIDWLKTHPGLKDVIGAVDDLRLAPVHLPMAIGGPLYYYAHGTLPAEAEAFFTALRSGANLPVGSPVLALRTFLSKTSRNLGSRGQRHGLAIAIKAFNFFAKGQSISMLSFKNTERYPTIISSVESPEVTAV